MRRPGFQTQVVLRREDGIAMLTMLMLTVILTVIGIAAITTTTMDMKSAGGEAFREASINTADACLGTGEQIIQQTLTNSAVPAVLLVATPTLSIVQFPLQNEILGVEGFVQLGGIDTADSEVLGYTPNAKLAMGGFAVDIDIDRLFLRAKPGGNLNAHDGDSAVASYEVLYRISCFSSGGLTRGRVTGVYACPLNKGICQRQIS